MTDVLERAGEPVPSEGESLYWFCFADGGVEYDESRSELRVLGQPVSITPKQCRILSALLRHAGTVVSFTAMGELAWGNRQQANPNTVTQHVSALKVILGQDHAGQSHGRFILSEHGIGYKLVGPVTRRPVGPFSGDLRFQVGQSVPERPGFRFVERVGRSPYAEVWRARNADLKQTRIYKFSLNQQSLAALRREAYISKLLARRTRSPDGFVRLLGRRFDARPYFAEWEDAGTDLGRWAEGGALLRMAHEDRLGLFLQIADAVAQAHEIRIGHNDLKPSNILVDPVEGGWRVRIGDFGSGLVFERSVLQQIEVTGLPGSTMHAQPLPGTVVRTAPEVRRGALPSERSDVYQLGLLLFQLVDGDLANYMEGGWQERITDELLRALIAAATDGRPDKRPPTAGALAQNIRDLPKVRAELDRDRAVADERRRFDDALHRQRIRRPWLIATASVLIVALFVSIALYLRADQARRKYLAEWRRSNDAVHFLQDDVLANVGSMTSGGHGDSTVAGLLLRAAEHIGTRFEGDPRSEGRLRLALGEGLMHLHLRTEGLTQMREGLDLLRRARPAEDIALDGAIQLATQLLDSGNPADLKEARLMVDDVRHGLDTDPQGAGKNPDLRIMESLARGQLELLAYDCNAALAELRRGEQLRALQIGRWPNYADSYGFDQFNTRLLIGGSLVCLGRIEEARTLYDSLANEPSVQGGLEPALAAELLLYTGDAMRSSGDAANAEKILMQGISQMSSLAGSDDFFVADGYTKLAAVHSEIAKWEAARDEAQKAIDIFDEKGGRDSVYYLRALALLGTIEYQFGHSEEALVKLVAARKGLVAFTGERGIDAQAIDFWRARVLADSGDLDQADALLQSCSSQALRAFWGGAGWQGRLDSARASILASRNRSGG